MQDRVATKRIAWLEGQQEGDLADHFKPQAWVALSERLAMQGYTEDARAVMIARHRRERRSRAMSRASRWQSRLLDWLALYGHNPWRTVVWMSAVVMLFALVWAGSAQLCSERECFDESVFVISNRDAYTRREVPPGLSRVPFARLLARRVPAVRRFRLRDALAAEHELRTAGRNSNSANARYDEKWRGTRHIHHHARRCSLYSRYHRGSARTCAHFFDGYRLHRTAARQRALSAIALRPY